MSAPRTQTPPMKTQTPPVFELRRSQSGVVGVGKKERSLTFLKPDAVVRRSAGCNIIKALLTLPDVRLVCFQEAQVSEELARLHYAEHSAKPFFMNIVDMICAKPGVVVLVLEGQDVVKKVRELLGPTFVEKAAAIPGTMRGKHGLVAGINACHASDSPASGKRETSLWMGVLGMLPDTDTAMAAAQEYLAKYDGKKPELAAEAQQAGRELQAAYSHMRDVLTRETDLDPACVNDVLRAAVLTLK